MQRISAQEYCCAQALQTCLSLSLCLSAQVLREHYLVYDGYALFANMGGLVGVLLGLSVVDGFDFAFDAVVSAASRIMKLGT